MKSIIKQSFWAVLIVLVAQVNAGGLEPISDSSKASSKTFELKLNNLKGKVQLSLRDRKNQVFYTKSISTDGSMHKQFDMSLFPDGNYELQLQDEEKRQVFPIEIVNDQLVFKFEDRLTHFFPVLNQKGSLVFVNMSALNDEQLSIQIYNDKNESIYKEVLSGSLNLGRIFDFSESRSGDYRFVLSSTGNVVSREVNIK